MKPNTWETAYLGGMAMVSLIGWRLAGLPGPLLATVPINAPSCLLAFLVGQLVALAERAGRDRRGTLNPVQIKRGIEASGLTFAGKHGAARRNAA